MNALISAEWLHQHLSDSNLVILDASIDFQIPGEVEKDKINLIPQSLRFDYDNEFCDPEASLPHMMPSEERFTQLAQKLGIKKDSLIVVYDNSGTFASPRAWWMFKSLGHAQVYILNGGLAAWKEKGYTVTQAYKQTNGLGDFSAKRIEGGFVSAQFVETEIDNKQSLTIDARSKARFNGEVAEPREGVRSGHIPNAICIPFAQLMDGHKVKPMDELKLVIDEALGDGSYKGYIFSCGSGVTACIVLLAFYLTQYENLSVYDGSWTEWGASTTLPIE